MAKSKTPAKRALQAEKNRQRNAMQKSKLKTALKKYQALIAADNKEAAAESLPQVISLIDKCVTKGLMHKNTAARRKSALARQYNQLVAEPAAETAAE